MKYIGGGGGDLARLLGRIHPPIPPEFALMLIEFPKNIGKSRDKSYPTDQKTSSIIVSAYRAKVSSRDVQEPEPESSKFFRSRIGLGVKFNVKTGVGVGAGVTISLSYYCNVN